jgi:hypothetical protein
VKEARFKKKKKKGQILWLTEEAEIRRMVV